MDTTTLTKTSRRLLGGELLEKGYSPQEVADITGAHIRTVFLWKQKIKQSGTESLIVTNHGGRPSKLTEQQLDELKTIITKGAVAFGFQNEHWDGKRIAYVIKQKYQIDYNYKYIPRLMRLLGLSYQKPMTRSSKRSQEAIDHWRKYTWREIKKKQKKAE
jgi:putative transposase